MLDDGRAFCLVRSSAGLVCQKTMDGELSLKAVCMIFEKDETKRYGYEYERRYCRVCKCWTLPGVNVEFCFPVLSSSPFPGVYKAHDELCCISKVVDAVVCSG